MDESKRLKTLRNLEILDTGPTPEFDRITSLATHIFNAPIALISLVDESRQWFKSVQGLSVQETSREISFCARAIQNADIMEVPNALDDPRFAENPLVTGEPYIRYYCGAPLVMRNGARIGTLCIIDMQSRDPISYGKRLLLKELTLQAIREIELHALDIDTDRINQILP
jgi:GAF domain-containing protein